MAVSDSLRLSWTTSVGFQPLRDLYISTVHVWHFIHKMYSFAGFSKCFHCIFSAETCDFCKFHTYIRIHRNLTSSTRLLLASGGKLGATEPKQFIKYVSIQPTTPRIELRNRNCSFKMLVDSFQTKASSIVDSSTDYRNKRKTLDQQEK